MEYIIAMKSGVKFRVRVQDFKKMVRDMEATIGKGTADNHFHVGKDIMVCIEDISAIYPADSNEE